MTGGVDTMQQPTLISFMEKKAAVPIKTLEKSVQSDSENKKESKLKPLKKTIPKKIPKPVPTGTLKNKKSESESDDTCNMIKSRKRSMLSDEESPIPKKKPIVQKKSSDLIKIGGKNAVVKRNHIQSSDSEPEVIDDESLLSFVKSDHFTNLQKRTVKKVVYDSEEEEDDDDASDSVSASFHGSESD